MNQKKISPARIAKTAQRLRRELPTTCAIYRKDELTMNMVPIKFCDHLEQIALFVTFPNKSAELAHAPHSGWLVLFDDGKCAECGGDRWHYTGFWSDTIEEIKPHIHE